MATAFNASLVAIKLRSCLDRFPDQKGGPIGLVLGTGWGETLELYKEESFAFSELPFLKDLADLAAHERRICVGKLGDKVVVGLRGRLHPNEGLATPGIKLKWRALLDGLYMAGCRTLVTTAAVGGLGGRTKKNDVVLIDGFLAPPDFNPGLFTGEFGSPDDVLKEDLREGMGRWAQMCLDLHLFVGGYAYWKGPHFEGKYNKLAFARDDGLVCVGMSTFPEAAIWSTKDDARMLALGFVTNDDFDEMGKLVQHRHTDNQDAARDKKRLLGELLRGAMSIV